METTLNNSLQPTSVSVLMINAQGMMLSVLGQDYFVSYNRVPERYPLVMKRSPLDMV